MQLSVNNVSILHIVYMISNNSMKTLHSVCVLHIILLSEYSHAEMVFFIMINILKKK